VRSRLVAVLAAAWLLCAGAALVHAEPSAAQKQKARGHLKKARTLYEAGRFDDAVAEYQAAYKLVGIADVLYNLAKIYEAKGDPRAELGALRRYLQAAPDGRFAAEATERAQALYREVLPERLRARFDEVKQAHAAYVAKHPGELDERFAAVEGLVADGDAAEVEEALNELGAELERRRAPKRVVKPSDDDRPLVDDHRVVGVKRERKPAPPLLKKWWFWTTVGGGAVVLGLAIGLGVGLGAQQDPSPSLGVLP
jgi:tetratricopeptide (TPR) repeat protein